MNIVNNQQYLTGKKDMRKKMVKLNTKPLLRPIKKAAGGDILTSETKPLTGYFESPSTYFNTQSKYFDTPSKYFDTSKSYFDTDYNSAITQVSEIIDDRHTDNYANLVFTEDKPLFINPNLVDKKSTIVSTSDEDEPLETSPKVSNGKVWSSLGKYGKPTKTDAQLEKMSLNDIFKYIGVGARIGGGRRTELQAKRFKSGTKSWHYNADMWGDYAHDVTAKDGNYDKLLKQLYSNPDFVRWLQVRGYGVLEETTKEVLARTGGTGPHLHIGPDTWAINMSKKRVSKLS